MGLLVCMFASCFHAYLEFGDYYYKYLLIRLVFFVCLANLKINNILDVSHPSAMSKSFPIGHNLLNICNQEIWFSEK